jgi:protein HIRA/HIR1
LITYAQRLAEEGFHDRLEQIFLDLLGPAYPLPMRGPNAKENGSLHSITIGKDGRWEETVAGLNKRRLLREVLEVTGKFRELQALNVQYDTALRDLEEKDLMQVE